MKLLFCLMLFILLFFNCKRKEESNFIDCGQEIIINEVYRCDINRGTVSLKSFKGTLAVTSMCYLVYEGSFPKWIKDNNKPDFSLTKYKFIPTISDIEAPFKLYKNKNECYFYVIKNKDTLKFKNVND